MQIVDTSIPEIKIIEPEVHADARGFFMETYRQDLFQQAEMGVQFVQSNHSGSVQGVLRGLHYQIRHTQGKLVRAVRGEVFDVAVDLRSGSPTIGKWEGVVLSGQNHRMLWIPEGFAHGFYTLSDWAEITYQVTDYYAPEWDRTLAWDDPDINIAWPLVNGKAPLVSEKDGNGLSLSEADLFQYG